MTSDSAAGAPANRLARASAYASALTGGGRRSSLSSSISRSVATPLLCSTTYSRISTGPKRTRLGGGSSGHAQHGAPQKTPSPPHTAHVADEEGGCASEASSDARFGAEREVPMTPSNQDAPNAAESKRAAICRAPSARS
eukprot:7391888-Prymnesium_polylepis.4